jgi:hypothetical protein
MSYADEIFEKSKDDRAMIVGSEIRGAIHEVRNERDALKAEVTALKKDDFDMLRIAESENEFLKTEMTRLTKERDFARADCRRLREIETRLRETLGKYGVHSEGCDCGCVPTPEGSVCDCGFDAALADSKERKT